MGGGAMKERVKAEALSLLSRGEGPKVDFKREYPGDEKMAKLISAIANTDDLNHENRQDKQFLNHGFILIGVEGNTVVGCDTWGEGFGTPEEASDEEKVKDKLYQKLANYVSPLPDIEVHKFKEGMATFWVVLILPSRIQPHVFIQGSSATVLVREGPNIATAKAQDYIRFWRNQIQGFLDEFSSKLRPLENQIHKLDGRLSSLERGLGKWLSEALQNLAPIERSTQRRSSGDDQGMLLSGDTTISLERAVRAWAQPDPVVEALEVEAEKVWEGLSNLPWTLVDTHQELDETVKKVGEIVLPLLKGLGALVKADSEEKYADATKEALQELGGVGNLPVSVNGYSPQLVAVRWYALLLIAYHLGMLAYFHSRPGYLSLLSELTFGRNEQKWLPHLRDNVAHLVDFFQRKYDHCDPLSWHLYQWLFIDPGVTWLNLPKRVKRQPRSYHPLSYTGGLDVFTEGEFVLGLLSLKSQWKPGEPPEGIRPLFGLYLLETSPSEGIRRVVRKPPEVLCKVLGLTRKGLRDYIEALRATFKGVAGRLPCLIGGLWWQEEPGPCPD